MNTLKLIQLVSAASLVALSLTTSTEPIVTVDTDTQVIKEISRKTSRPNLWGLLPAAALGASALGFIGKDDDSEDDPKPTAKRRKVSVPVSTDSDIEDGDEARPRTTFDIKNVNLSIGIAFFETGHHRS